MIRVVYSGFPRGIVAVFGGSRICYCFKKEDTGRNVSEVEAEVSC